MAPAASRGMALFTVPVPNQIHTVAGLPPTLGHFFRVHEHDTTVAFDAAVTVFQAVNRGVVLVVRPQGHHDVCAPVLRHQVRQLMECELGETARGVELGLVAGRIRQLEAVWGPNAFVVCIKTRNGGLD